MGQENYGMAFYTPSSNDRLKDIEQEWKSKLKLLQNSFDNYRNNAETAIKKALNQPNDTRVTICEYGEVFRHGGRIDQIL